MSQKPTDKNKLFLELYDSFSDEIFRFCLAKVGNRDEALDITQDVFIKTWDYLRQGKQIALARGFLYKIARNSIIDFYRKKKTVSLDHMVEETEQDIADPVEPDFGADYDREELMERLKRLPEHHYEILVMRFIQELTIPEISEAYGESQNTISVRIHRAVQQAQKLFKL